MKLLFQRELSDKSGYFIDVGANFGQTLIAVLEVSTNIKYMGVEPQPGCASAVLQFIVDNKLPNHRLICCCLSDGDDLVELGFSREGDVRASFVEEFRPEGTFSNSMLSPVISGDQLIKQAGIDDVAFIKIDVEGAELEVLNSFRQTLTDMKPTLTFEILPNILVSTGQALSADVIQVRRRREAEIAALLAEMHYEIFLLEGETEVLHAIEPSPDGPVRNYVARPQRQASG